MTLFGQFFDHGLDLINKGGNGTVFVPLAADDPLRTVGPDGIPGTGDEVPANQAFMVLTRASATIAPGPDGILGTSDDIRTFVNQTTPFVDQSQTYASDPSHQVFLREYMIGVDGKIHSTGKLLQHAEGKDNIAGTADDNSGMATWADLKANALKLGIVLTDYNVNNVPLLATDAYGNFLAGAHGFVQVVVNLGGGAHGLVEMNPASPQLLPANTVFTGHAFIDDMAHTASPFATNGAKLIADADTIAGNAVAAGQYDDELLNAHYVAGDGRINENIALTAVHAIFHDEHNRLIEQVKSMVRAELAKGDTAFASNWVLAGANLADGIQDNEWNGERLFQVAKFGTETQYQHLVFEEFARKIAPTIHAFGNIDIHLDPAITSEFANAIYRFGHSMLTENVARYELNADGTIKLDAQGNAVLTQISLIEAFTNPLAYAARGAAAAAEIVQGSTHQIGSEIDEFVTGSLRNNLLGLPLDLAALNLARGRDAGVAPLNLVRAQIFDATHDPSLKPYANWAEFGQYLKHAASLINFIAAYGTHASIAGASSLDGKRAAALALVTMGLDPMSSLAGADAQHRDAWDFMHSRGAYANDLNSPLAVHARWSTGSITGVDNIDLWIGGLAEKQSAFGGLLGSTFNFIFETQLESLQDGDRLYYLPRIEGMDFAAQIEANSFASMIMANTGAKHLPASIFLTPEYTIEASTITNDPATWPRNPVTGAFLVEKLADGTIRFIGDDNFLGNTIVLGGTEGDDRLQAGHADDDTVWGDGGNDWIDGGDGDDFLYGGDGDDIIYGGNGADTIHGDDGNDTLYGGNGDDLIFGGAGHDLIYGGAGIDTLVGGEGNDIIFGEEDDDEIEGNAGDDWLEGGAGGDLLIGDQGAPTGQVPLIGGNDVLIGGPGGDRMQGFTGDDIMLGEGGFDRFEGRLGFDWASFERETHGVSVDMTRREFIPQQLAPAGDAVRDVFVEVEGVSGSRFDDYLKGTDNSAVDVFNQLTNVNLIFGLSTFFPAGPVAFSGGNIMLGGAGNDFIQGGGGNDIIDGDAWLHVDLTRDGQGRIFAGSQIIREIRWDMTPGNIDTAVYTDVMANYLIDLTPDAQGFISVTHIPTNTSVLNEGTDKLRNIERLQFADQTISIDPGLNPNAVPTGQLTILGDTNLATPAIDPRVNSALTVQSTITDADGIVGPVSFQWQYQDPAHLGWVNIVGATGTTFTPTNFYLGSQLRVVETYKDGKGFRETVFSAPTNTVLADGTVNTAPFVVPQQGIVGLADTGARTGFAIDLFLPLTQAFGDNETAVNLLTFTAKLANGQPLSSVGLTFQLVPDGLGGVSGGRIVGIVATPGPVAITVSATDAGPGVPLTVTNTFTINVQDGDRAPTVVAGSASMMENTSYLGYLPAGIDPDGDPLLWRLVPNSAINGIVLLDQGTGQFRFTPFVDVAGDASFQFVVFDGMLSSAPQTMTITIHPVNDGSATLEIFGDAVVGSMLEAWIGSDPDGDGIPIFTWFRGATVIATGATYVLTQADAGQLISVRASYTDGQGFAEVVTSLPTSAVTGGVGVNRVGTNGNDNMAGTAGDDILRGARGDDILTGLQGSDQLFGDAGNDTFIATIGDGDDVYDGGAGNDTYTLAATSAAAFVNLLLGRASSAETGDDRLISIENVTGGSGDDVLIGDAAANILIGGAGDDTLDGGSAGKDTLRGGTGDDTYIVSHTGITIIEAANEGIDTVRSSVTFTLGNNVENLTLTGRGNINGTGNALDNIIIGNSGDNSLNGGGGNDTFIAFAGDGNDRYNGGAGIDTLDMSAITASVVVDLMKGTASGAHIGNDKLVSIENIIGGFGNDMIIAGLARESFTGGAGNDTFVFQSAKAAGLGAQRDVITDFMAGEDHIDLRSIDANTTAAGRQAFVFVGQAAAGTLGAMQLGFHYETIGGVEHTIIEANIKTSGADAAVDFQIDLLGHVPLTATDFFLG